jgi:ATP-dependent Zn protease
MMKKKSGGAGMESLFDKKKFEAVKPENIKISFKDVAGMHEAKF